MKPWLLREVCVSTLMEYSCKTLKGAYNNDHMTKPVFRSLLIEVMVLNRKQEILEAATTSFSLFGYKATTMEQVAKIAKVGKGTVYNFFTNKQELLHEVVVAMIRDMKLETDSKLDPSLSFMENVHTALMHLLKFRERHLLFAKLLEEEKQLGTPEVLETLQGIETEIVSYIAVRIRAAIDKGEAHSSNPELVAYLMLKSYLALVVDWQENHKEALNEETIVTLLKETVFRGLENNKTT